MRKLLEIIKYDWNTLKSGMEYDIINKYTYVGAFYAQLFACKIVNLYHPLFCELIKIYSLLIRKLLRSLHKRISARNIKL